MSISFVQQRKDLYAADFRVVHNGTQVGELSMEGWMGSREGKWSGTVMGHQVNLAPSSGGRGFRPYDIWVDGRTAGSVAQIDVKNGLFSRYQYHEIRIGGRTYELYSVGLGKQGGAGCLYCEGQQLAEIDNEATVRNELYEYDIFAVDSDAAFASVLLCCYMYVRGCYRPGEKPSASAATYVTVTTNKVLKAKYDPNFKSTHRTI